MKNAPLREIGQFQAGLTLGPKRASYPVEVSYIRVANVLRGGVDLSDVKVTHALPAEVAKTALRLGDVLIVEGHGNVDEIGRAALWTGDSRKPMSHQNHIIRLRPDARRAWPAYVAAFVNSPRGRAAMRAIANTTSGLNTIAINKLKEVSIPLPPIEDQHRIAAIIDQADALYVKRRQVLAYLDTLAQSIFRDMFGDPDRATETVPFGEVARLSGGRNLVADDSTADSPYRVLKISAVTGGHFKAWESKPLPEGYVPPPAHLIRPGDLLMSRANTAELVGAVAYVHETPDNLALPDKVWRFEWRDPDGSAPLFYHALFQTMSIRRRISRLSSGTGGSMKNVSKAKLESMPLPRVAAAKQIEFAERAHHFNGRRLAVQQAIDAQLELFSSLQARAFRGEL